MYVLELAAQAVQGFAPSGRTPLKQGYTVLTPATGQAPLAGLVGAILYADGRGEDARFAAPGQRAKVGLTLLGNDQTTYRLVRELGGAGALTRLNRQTSAFEPVSQDAGEIQQFLKGQVGLPTKTAFEQVFCFTSAQLPSRRPKPKPKVAPAAKLAPALGTARPVEAASDVAAAEEKLRQLEEELAFTRGVEELQFRADGVAQELFTLEGQMQGTEGLREALAEAQAARDRAPTAESVGLPADIIARAERLAEVTARRDRELAKLKGEGGDEVDLQARAAMREVPPVWLDQRFQGAVGAGVALLLAAVFAPGSWKYLGLLDIPAFGFGALLALEYVGALQDAERSSRRGGVAASREKKILADYEAEAAPVHGAMKQLGVDSVDELVQHLSQRPLYQAKVDELTAQLRAMEQSPELAALAGQVGALRAEQERLNAEITERGTYVRDLREIEREIARTRESISLAHAGGGTPAVEPTTGAAPTPDEALEDPAPALLRHASDLFTSDVTSAAATVRDRLAQYLSALTDRRCTAVDFDREGRATVTTAQGPVPAGLIAPRDLDLLQLALKLTVIEKHCARFKVPVLIDDGFASVDEAKLPLLARMLKHAGTITQVLHLTGHPAFASAADTHVSV